MLTKTSKVFFISPLSGLLRDPLLTCGVFPGQQSSSWLMNMFAFITSCGCLPLTLYIIYGSQSRFALDTVLVTLHTIPCTLHPSPFTRSCCRANMARVRQLRLDPGLGFQVQVPKTFFKVFSFSSAQGYLAHKKKPPFLRPP